MRVAIIGGGISGLTTAYKLSELSKDSPAPIEFTLFEASNRLGGIIETEKRDGFVLEKGPDAFISDKPWALHLCRRLGVEKEIIETNPAFRKGFILKKQKLISIPKGFYLIAPTKIAEFLKSPLLSWMGKCRMLLEPLIPAKKGDEDESIASFVRRRFGKEALAQVGQPMLAGIYTGDPENLSLLSALPRFRQYEKEYGSVIRGLISKKNKEKDAASAASGPRYSLFLSFKEGMETLVEALKAKLPKDSLRVNTPVQKIRRDATSGMWMLTLKEGEAEQAFDAVCLTVSAKAASQLTKDLNPTLSKKLSSIAYESVATLSLAYKKEAVRHALDGFGFVVPAVENSPLIACTFSHTKFQNRAPKDQVLLRAFIGGAFGRKYFDLSDKEIEKEAERELAGILGISARPIFSVMQRYKDSMAQYSVGHTDLLKAIDEEVQSLPGFFLTGASYRGVGIPDCVRDAEEKAVRIVSYARPLK